MGRGEGAEGWFCFCVRDFRISLRRGIVTYGYLRYQLIEGEE